jgi:Tfp pilus assembly protein FimT
MRNNKSGQHGFTFVEVLVILAMVGTMAAITIPWFHKIYKRNRLRSAVQEVYSMVLATRMQAVKRDQTVIVKIVLNNRTLCGETGQCMIMWADNAPNNYVQDVGEPTIQRQSIPDYVYFRRAPSGSLNGSSAVSFDGYPGAPGATDSIVFQGDGTLVPPTSSNSLQPLTPSPYTASVPHGSIDCNPSSRCRGIFIADNNQTGNTSNRNVFRLSVDDSGRTGRVSLLKWLPRTDGGNPGENDYVPGPWVWAD